MKRKTKLFEAARKLPSSVLGSGGCNEPGCLTCADAVWWAKVAKAERGVVRAAERWLSCADHMQGRANDALERAVDRLRAARGRKP